MKIPKSFVLGGVTWKVEYTKFNDYYGTCDFSKYTIYLSDDMSEEKAQHTFCHELEHAIMFSMGLRDHNEREVDAKATFLHQYLKVHGK